MIAITRTRAATYIEEKLIAGVPPGQSCWASTARNDLMTIHQGLQNSLQVFEHLHGKRTGE